MGYENSHIIPSPPFSLYVLIQWFITIRAQTQEKVPRMAHILARIYSLAHIVEVGCSNPNQIVVEFGSYGSYQNKLLGTTHV